MRTPVHQYGYVALKRSDSFGRVKRFTAAGTASHVAGPTAPAVRSEIEAIALRTFAASGFGGAEIGRAQPLDAVDSVELYHLARAHRSYHLAEIFAAMVRVTVETGRRLVARWKRQRQARATYLALQALNERTLRDLGFDRSELLSVAVEAAGSGDFTRVRFMQAARG